MYKCTHKSLDIPQLDGNITDNSYSSTNSELSETKVDDSSSVDTSYDSEDEVDGDPIPADLSPIPGQNVQQNQPLVFDINLDKNVQSSFLPLCLMTNARSVYNKQNNLREMLKQIGPSVMLVSETWERERSRLDTLLNSRVLKSISSYRKTKPGGGCAIIYNETQFNVTNPEIEVPEDVEAVWAIFTPKTEQRNKLNVKRIAIGSVYVSPRSQHKVETIDHIIETIHIIRGQYDNEVNFLIGGDFNRLDITEILDSYGGLKQVISLPTRESATLEILLTDLHTMFHPPTTLPPLQVDTDKIGKDSDHNVVVFAPISNVQYRLDRTKKTVTTRPVLDSQVLKFEQELAQFPWAAAFENKSADEQTDIFHAFLKDNLDKYFPEKVVKISSMDKKWMTPVLKRLHRKMQREYYHKRRSTKYKTLKAKFKKLKRKAIKTFYYDFVCEMKNTDPGKWYAMAKRIGAVDVVNNGDVHVESLSNLNNNQAAHKIAEHFASISNEYSPINLHDLPCYLPAQLPPQVEEYEVYQRLIRVKKTRSTLPIDIPDKIRQECSPLLAGPLSSIINNSLQESVYPTIWKQEWVTPAPKITHPQDIGDLRKISSTSDYSKVYEGFLKDWVMEDIAENIDIGQFGGQPGIGTEHLVVCLLDRVLKLLDRHSERSAIIMAGLDWSAAFDRQDPTIAVKKFIQLGVRPSLIPLLSSYLTDRKMKVKFNGEVSDFLALIGGGPQGTLLGQIEYLVQSNDNADNIPPEDRFKYIDDLSILQLICMSGLLIEYDFHEHVASDVGIDQKFLPAASYGIQGSLDQISTWTSENLMRLNAAKCNYMIFSRSKENFSTRLAINNTILERKHVNKILGIYISDDLSWSRNCQEICKKAYSRLSMLTKLKYVGVKVEDLLDIYVLHIRSLAEYCSVVFHSSLTVGQSNTIERIQRTCLKIILGDMYIDYTSALEMSGLDSLYDRRSKRCLDFSLKSIKHHRNSRLFPINQNAGAFNARNSERFQVNFASTSTYRDSTIPFCQKLLNAHFNTK